MIRCNENMLKVFEDYDEKFLKIFRKSLGKRLLKTNYRGINFIMIKDITQVLNTKYKKIFKIKRLTLES